MSRCVVCQVFGKVQGVWFRAGAQQEAQRLGLDGYARNLSDGTVEVLACGDKEAIAELKEWLWQGPPLAEVTDILCRPAEQDPLAGFVTG